MARWFVGGCGHGDNNGKHSTALRLAVVAMLSQKDIENRSRTDESFPRLSDIPPFAPPTRLAVDFDLHN